MATLSSTNVEYKSLNQKYYAMVTEGEALAIDRQGKIACGKLATHMCRLAKDPSLAAYLRRPLPGGTCTSALNLKV